jgi:hypothetical protein
MGDWALNGDWAANGDWAGVGDPDPANLQAVQVGDDVELTWDASF